MLIIYLVVFILGSALQYTVQYSKVQVCLPISPAVGRLVGQYSTVQYSVGLVTYFSGSWTFSWGFCSTVQYSTVQYSTLQHSTV